MPLYEIAVLEHPTDKAAKDGELEKLIYGPSTVIAKDDKAAAMQVMLGDELRTAMAENNADSSRVEVVVRPFM